MNRRPPARHLILLILVAANTYLGLANVMTSYHQLRAERALEEGELDRSFASLKRALAWGPREIHSHLMAVQVLHNAMANGLPLLELVPRGGVREMHGAGVGAAARAIALNPADALAWFHLGNIYQALRSSRLRLERLHEAALATAPGATTEAPEEGEEERPGLDPEDLVAVAAVMKAEELQPEYFFHHDYLAELYWNRGLRSQAAAEIRASMMLTPRLEAHPVLNDSEFLEGLSEVVLAGIQDSASNEFVGPITAARARAEVLAKLGRLDEAVAAYDELRSLGGEPLEAECDLALGKLEQRRGRFRKSVPVLERALDEGGGGSWSINAHYYLGIAHSRLGDHERALEHFRLHLAGAPNALHGYNALASELETLGRSDEAERLLIAAVRRFPSRSSTYRKVIEHLRAHGKADKAIPYAEALSKLEPADRKVRILIEDLKKESGRW